jgi:hypothetical protein
LNPPNGATLTVYVAVCPALIVAEVWELVSLKSATAIAIATDALWLPLVPFTVKLSVVPPLTAESPLTVNVLLWPGLMDAGLNAQLAGALPEQLRLIPPVKPKLVAAEIVKVVESTPAITEVELLFEDNEYATTPLPDSEIVWGLLGALSLKVSDPVRLPVAVGVKVTLIVHVPPTATLPDKQLSVSAKSPLVGVMLVNVRGALPLLVTEIACEPLVVLTP